MRYTVHLSPNRGEPITVRQRIVSFLIANRRKPFCDKCITSRLTFVRHQQIQEATAALGATGRFARHMGVCFDCGGLKLVVEYSAERSLTSPVLRRLRWRLL